MRLGGGAVIVIVIVSLLFGVNPLALLGMMEGGGPVVQPPSPQTGAVATARASARRSDPEFDIVRAHVVGDTEDVWTALFKQMGSRYEPPTLVMFTARTQSACGQASAARGTVLLPRRPQGLPRHSRSSRSCRRASARPATSPQAYVIAHEIGHHVQNLLGTMDKFDRPPRSAAIRAQRNELSVRLELQADCYAGVWGFYAAKRNLLEPGDVEEGLRAAAAVGDDAIQKGTRATSCRTRSRTARAAQRVRWFRQGMRPAIRAAATRSPRRTS